VVDAGNGNVFVSHAGRDLAWAEWVAWQLRDSGYHVELDRWDWAAGDNFVVRMSQALDRAETVVAVVSEAYFEVERFATEEWTAVLAAKGRLVMLRVEDVSVAAVLRPYIFRDLFGQAEAVARQVVLQAVGGPTGPPSSAPAFPGAAPKPAPDGPRLPGVLPPVWNVPIQNVVFTGRDAMLAALRDSLAGGSPVQVLHGFGGVGKSTLAIEYAHRFANGYEVVWWIDAEQPDRIGEQLAALALTSGWAQVGMDVPTCATLAGHRLRDSSGWLLVFDNVEDPATLARWLPPGQSGHVVVTSRNPSWRQVGTPVPVDVFARTESITLLRRLAPAIAEADANRISEALGDLPLALAQAAGMLTETGITPPQYLSVLADQTAEVLAESAPVGYPVSLAAAVAVTMDRLDSADPAAVQLLRLCAALAPEPIPTDIFTTAPADVLPAPLNTVASSTIALHRSIGRLGRYGLARIGDGTVQLHRLTQAILTMTDPDRLDSRRRIAALLAAAVPADMGDQPSTWPRWALLLPHLLAADPADAEDHGLRWATDRASWYLLSRGELQTGFDLAERLYHRWRERLGPDHPSTQGAAQTFAHAQRAFGRYRDAQRLDEEAWTNYRRVLGDDDFSTLTAASNLAGDLRALGQYERARAMDEDTLAHRRRLLGDDHPHTLASAANLAGDLAELGEYERARELNQDNLARRRRVFGDDHPKTLLAAGNLAADLTALGEHELARELDEDTLARRRRVLGEDHPDTLMSANNLAVQLTALGEHERARELDEDTLARRRRVLGEDHPETLHSAQNLAIDLENLAKYQSAEEPADGPA
jgi:hypothetical protein